MASEVEMPRRSKRRVRRSREHPVKDSPIGEFAPVAVASDLSWVPDMIELDKPPVSAEEFVQGYLADPKKWHSSTSLFDEPREIVLKRVLAIVAQAQLPDHEEALGQIGAGPLEDMMSDTLLDDLRPWMPFSEAMCYAFRSVRMSVEPPRLQRRLDAMLSQSKR